ncbi:MAG: M20/M25/M40 family metallo-hydrolase [Acidobacteriales bacterium]|nr:M20/M25/M40 family metallo-hydrolase [Terriglobales bacterium]
MPYSARPELPSLLNPQSQVARLTEAPEVRAAGDWFRRHEARFAGWQKEITAIAAPPFGEGERGAWLAKRFAELGLEDVHRDAVGNVFGIYPGAGRSCVSLSAHLDTVFPAGTPLRIREEKSRLYGPGISDNAAGLTAMLAMAAWLQSSPITLGSPVVFVGNVGEEGEGDLRGMRHIFTEPRWRDTIACSLILDGAGSDSIVAEALGSRRFQVTVSGPGGHSWSDFGTANPIVVLASAIQRFTATAVPTLPKTTYNIGVIAGGTSVNSVPESASMRVDMRSGSPAEIDRLEQILRECLHAAVEREAASSQGRRASLVRQAGLRLDIVSIGDRPAGELAPTARILQVLRAVDAHLGISAQVQRASTDANIPLSMGREAIAIGGGGTGGGAHTLQEWFDATGRELGLKRVLLTLLALAQATPR